jgi:hypothetical protein
VEGGASPSSKYRGKEQRKKNWGILRAMVDTTDTTFIINRPLPK